MPRLRLPAGWGGSRPGCRRPPIIAVRRRTYPVNGSIGLTPRRRPNGSHRTWTVRSARAMARRKAPPGTGIGCMCHHPLFVLNRFGHLERRSLRPGNVHSADGRENVLKPVLARYADRELMRLFRADTAFAVPELYKTPEAEGCSCAVRPGKTAVPESRIAPVLKRPAGRPPTHVRRICGDFAYQAASRDKPWRVVRHARAITFQPAEAAVARSVHPHPCGHPTAPCATGTGQRYRHDGVGD